MDTDRLRAFILSLPHAVETMQWGANLVFWVGDKALGGKMFALLNLDADDHHALISYAAGPERFHDLLEVEGITPAPYFARIHWVAVERWDAFRDAEWQRELAAAHALTLAKLPRKVLAALALPTAAQKRLVSEARSKVATKAKR
jgi:predicted DNA-binding protein (MmcQ/YjbR family)